MVDTVIHENECQYPELREKQSYITRVVRTEEENFAKTIDGGMKIFADLLAEHKAKGETVFSGADAFKLYDTYGFPVDLTQEMAEDEGLSVDQDAFHRLMEEQRVRARKAREALGDLGWAGIEFGKDMPETKFLGYTQYEAQGKILALVAEDEMQDAVPAGTEAIMVLDQTPFYAEMGGQVADQGTIVCGDAVFEVTNVQKNKGGKYMHYGVVRAGAFTVGDTVDAAIDVLRRRAICRGHSATHLLQKALQTVLGDHVHQAGSLVEPDYLRFDFTHFSAVTPDELLRVEAMVNDAILDGGEIVTQEMSQAEAKKLGAMALFGEKYGDTVRVVRMKDSTGADISMEFCGGTHLDCTAKAGSFNIVSEGSVASGVRRIEAYTGKKNIEMLQQHERMFFQQAALLKVRPEDLGEKLKSMLTETRDLQKIVEQMRSKEALGEARNFLAAAKEVGALRVVTANLGAIQVPELRKLGDFLRDKEPGVVAVLAAVNGEKISFLAACGPDAVKQGVKAGDVIRKVTQICGGSGGGKPDSAMGGGKDALKIDDALAVVDDLVAEKLGL